MKNYYIHLIRHAEAEGSDEGRYIGVTDCPLSEYGREDAAEKRRNYNYPQVERVYTSPLARCVETCDILYPELEPIAVSELAEYDFGDFENKTVEELENDPGFVEWAEGGFADAPRGGEDPGEFAARIRDGLRLVFEDMVKDKCYSAAVVTHGGIVSGLLAMFGFPRRRQSDWLCDYAAGYTVMLSAAMWMRDNAFEIAEEIPY